MTLRAIVATALGLLAPVLELHEEMPGWIQALAARQAIGPAELQDPSVWGSDRWPFEDVWEAAEHVMGEDPVAFAESMMLVRNAAGEPHLRLWDYQKAALRYGGDLILQCAPETGKTLCAGIWVLHRFFFHAGDVLVAGAFGAHAREIHRELIYQLTTNPWFSDRVDWDGCKTQPYPEIKLLGSGRLMHFRPVGMDGTAVRGLHVLTLVVDEAVKIKGKLAKEAWANIDSRLLPGGRRWFLSTPDGQRLTPFIERCLKTTEIDPLHPPKPVDDIRKLVWSKRLQPDPFFSAARLAKWVEDYGGEGSQEFARNVDGEIGQPTRAVFDFDLLRSIAGYVPYQRFRVEQKGAGLELRRWRLRPGGDPLEAMDDDDAQDLVLELLDELQVEKSAIVDPDIAQADKVEAWLELLEPLISSFGADDLVAGIDAGKVADPCELLVGRVRGERVEWVLRLQLLRLDYRAQDALVRALDHLLAPKFGWGLDATSGPAITEYLPGHCEVRGARCRPSVSNYLMNIKVDRLDGKGKPMKVAGEKEGRDVERWTCKAQGVNLLETAARAGNRLLPYDPEIIRELAGYEEYPGRVYTRKNDHVIAAAIVLELRLFDARVAHWTKGAPPALPPPIAGPKRTETAERSDGLDKTAKAGRGRLRGLAEIR